MYNITPVKNRHTFHNNLIVKNNSEQATVFSVHYISTQTDGMHTTTESTVGIYMACKGNFKYGLLMYSVKSLL